MSSLLTTSSDRFRVDRLDATDGHVRWVLRGSLDADAAPAMAETFEQALESGETHVEIDLENVVMISSAGIGSLIAGIGEFRDEGGSIRVAALSSAVHHVFAMLDLLGYFECPQKEC